MKKKIQAFTLLELMIVIALIGVSITMMMPGLTNYTNHAGLTTNNNDLVASLQLARSSAIRLQDRVVVCRSENSMTATPSCSTTSTDWHTGWIVFQDTNNNAQYESTDDLIRVHPAVTIQNITIIPVDLGGTPTNISTYVSFGPPAGEPMTTAGANQSGIFRVCAGSETATQRGVIINFSGRISSTRETTVINSACPAAT